VDKRLLGLRQVCLSIAGLRQSSYRAAKTTPATMSACPHLLWGRRLAAPMHQVAASHGDADAVTELRILHVHSRLIVAWCKCGIEDTCQACCALLAQACTSHCSVMPPFVNHIACLDFVVFSAQVIQLTSLMSDVVQGRQKRTYCKSCLLGKGRY